MYLEIGFNNKYCQYFRATLPAGRQEALYYALLNNLDLPPERQKPFSRAGKVGVNKYFDS